QPQGRGHYELSGQSALQHHSDGSAAAAVTGGITRPDTESRGQCGVAHPDWPRGLPLPPQQRRARLAALFGVIAAVYLFIARPLRKRVSDAQVARLIEERHRGLEDRLVSAVEVADESARAASPAIVDRLVDDASRRVAEVSPDEIIPKQKLWR